MLFWINENITFWTIEAQFSTPSYISATKQWCRVCEIPKERGKNSACGYLSSSSCEVSEYPGLSDQKYIISDLQKWTKEAPTDYKGGWQKRSFRACQHDSHDTGIWISSCTGISEILEADKKNPRKFTRTTRYSKSPSCTTVNGKVTGRMKLQSFMEAGRWKHGRWKHLWFCCQDIEKVEIHGVNELKKTSHQQTV